MTRADTALSRARRLAGSPDAAPAPDQQQPLLHHGAADGFAKSGAFVGNPSHAESSGGEIEGAELQAGLGGPHQQQHRHPAEDAMSLDGGNDGQRLEVPLDDGDDQQLGHHGAVHQDDGGCSGAEGGLGGQDAVPEQEAPAGPVTETIAAGLVGMHQRRAAIEHQIDELTSVALDYLEAMKKDFLERMARLKAEVGGYCSGQEGAWRETNAMTQEALGRLGAARDLVRSLGLNANSSGQPLPPGSMLGGDDGGGGGGGEGGGDDLGLGGSGMGL